MKFKTSRGLKDYILNELDQVEIFAKFLQISAESIEDCISNSSKKIQNPLRNDNDPSLGFKYSNSYKIPRLRMHDFANSTYSGDCFYIVGYMLGLNSNNPDHFVTICKTIIKAMTEKGASTSIKVFETHEKKPSDISRIEPSFREVNKEDMRYFSKFGFTKEEVEIDFPPAQYVTMYNSEVVIEEYVYRVKDPCYVIKLDSVGGIPRYKLYFPLRNKKDRKHPRFRTNYPLGIEDVSKLKPNRVLILQKAKKDELCLKKIILKSNKTDISTSRISSESALLSKAEIDILKARYDVIYTMFDSDSAGEAASGYYYSRYGFVPLYWKTVVNMFHPDLESVKDEIFTPKNVSDYIERYGVEVTEKIVLILLNTL